MTDRITVIVPKQYEYQLSDPDTAREVRDVQEYFDRSDFSFAEEEISFVFLKGFYRHIKRKMLVVGVYVNKTNQPLLGLKSTLRLEFQNNPAEIAAMHVLFPFDFTGKIQPDEGMLVHLEIPVRALQKDQTFGTGDVTGELCDVEIACPKAEKNE